MPPQVDFHPLAADEAVAARLWYFEINESLAEAFNVELDRAVERVATSPHRWAQHLHGTQAFLLHRFPYFIVYRLVDKQIQVIAVQHAKRRPGYWRSRIESD
jgi:toxin ParE1/3/4